MESYVAISELLLRGSLIRELKRKQIDNRSLTNNFSTSQNTRVCGKIFWECYQDISRHLHVTPLCLCDAEMPTDVPTTFSSYFIVTNDAHFIRTRSIWFLSKMVMHQIDTSYFLF